MEYENKAKGSILRSKVKFYEEGEKCTKYFLCQEKSNKRKTTVRKLIIDNKETTDFTKLRKILNNSIGINIVENVALQKKIVANF